MNNLYISPLSDRYASKEMQYLFSKEFKIKTFRYLWTILADEERKLGLDISLEQVEELTAHIDDIDYQCIDDKEKEVLHDVMANIYAYGVKCPKAKKIIHLGATSCYVDDNADTIAISKANKIILSKLIQVMKNLRRFVIKYKDLPCLGYTHLQPAQLVTLGKRFSLTLYNLYLDYEHLSYFDDNLLPLSCKGATGTLASFLDLFDGDKKKAFALDRNIAKRMGFKRSLPVSGQTYTRKIDAEFLNTLASLASSCAKFAFDLRLLQSFMEVEEPFEKKQVGSSAMPYKRNPMRSERINGLARYVISLAMNGELTASEQFLERTLDDSSNRRLSISEAYLASDAILNIMINVTDNLVVNKKIIQKHVFEKLPFIASENIMMEACKKGGDRQVLHEKIRQYSSLAIQDVKDGKENKLLTLIMEDKDFHLTKEEIEKLLDPQKFTGLASEQVTALLEDYIDPLLKRRKVKKIEVKMEH